MALNDPGGSPRAGGFKFSGGIPGGLHGLEEGSNVATYFTFKALDPYRLTPIKTSHIKNYI